VSRIRGTQGIQEVTGGHEEGSVRVQGEPGGHHRTQEDTTSSRFGTVRPRVQIPGPRPILEFARLSGPLVFITVIATFVLSLQQSRQDDQMKESIARIKARGKQFDSEFSSQYEVPIEEAVKRLGQVPGAFIRIASWLSREIPQDFGT